MASAKRRYSSEEFARRGDEILESQVRPRLEPEDDGKFVAIDVESGAYELDSARLLATLAVSIAAEGLAFRLAQAAIGFKVVIVFVGLC